MLFLSAVAEEARWDAKLKHLFAVWDYDKTGYLEKPEIEKVLTKVRRVAVLISLLLQTFYHNSRSTAIVAGARTAEANTVESVS